MALPDEIRAGLARGDLFVEYLPTVRLTDARCVGGEALVRWRRGGEVLPASAFLPRIENTPLSGRLTYWVIETVGAELGEWLGVHREAHVSINVPPEIVGRGRSWTMLKLQRVSSQPVAAQARLCPPTWA